MPVVIVAKTCPCLKTATCKANPDLYLQERDLLIAGNNH